MATPSREVRSIHRTSQPSEASVPNAADSIPRADEPAEEAARGVGAKRGLGPVVIALAGEITRIHVLGDVVGEAIRAPADEPATEWVLHDRAEPDLHPLLDDRFQEPPPFL